ncbi:dysbindin-like isoform X2 [Salvelinus fontinalis]|uniref:dysbindin-like isoform X2 n=1 Tax=Salvelinus fontinalis TaxID=8038 RepID=UPI00248595C3|nr:dysbindin-like isoform X2 [Salvelinus fontinalis]XP_055732739.1 dysbindin-like isoform X2 [Salvelinus fontinalis]XP_055732740.1 dysbindin-like isoform X2 [Salvelinus fontinalis]XP_055732742.1 dysbindin-like isoform X2 [Salvelinus fontinalis]XP_055732743.1 dysbindin-like isoform X2 [Salvelinus fontinalis]XP_055732744.1 dysbindin-like isoform X2 [Salvelinus fontinalis]
MQIAWALCSPDKVLPQVNEEEPPQVKPKEVESSQFKLKEVEPALVNLKERQKFFEEAFQQDMDQYLSTGYLQIAERRGSFSSMEVNVDMLEQMDLMNMVDHESLDVFLHSGGEDNSVASPMLGPDVESITTEITLQVPTQAELRHKLSSLSSTDSQDTEAREDEGGREDRIHCPVRVQSYEIEVPPNTGLAGRPLLQPLPPPRNQTLKH